ncbi:MAG: hydrogenase formation protein HypD [Aestuariibacter sp.]
MPYEFNPKSFRDPAMVHRLVSEINKTAEAVAARLGRPVQIMEVCGGHTHAIFHSGINQLLCDQIEFIHGPGCPVCVLPTQAIDQAVKLAQRPDTLLASFGDVLRVPGSNGSLQQVKARGADIQVLYSPFDSIALAQQHPDKQVVFFAIGFDTTMPSIAFTIQQAHQLKITNLKFLCYHIRLLPTLTALLQKGEVYLDGFVGPGHVSIVLGSEVYQPIAQAFRKPLVIAGFEPIDFLQALLMLLRQLQEQRCEIENAYGRVVTEQGNLSAQQAISAVFRDSTMHWRGMGAIPRSVGSLQPFYKQFDASDLLTKPEKTSKNEPAYCAEVLIGKRKPDQCPYFKSSCHPEDPKGALMVSSEGACAAYFKYKQQPLHGQDGVTSHA